MDFHHQFRLGSYNILPPVVALKHLILYFRFGAYITSVFLLTKLMYLANIIVQLFLLGRVLGMDYSTYGIDVRTHNY